MGYIYFVKNVEKILLKENYQNIVFLIKEINFIIKIIILYSKILIQLKNP